MLLPKDVVATKGRTAFRLFSFLLLLAIACILTIPMHTSLVIRDAQTQKLIWSSRLGEEGEFSIRWTHSIHRSEVEERYRTAEGQLILSEMTFHDYGIGMENELAPGEELVIANGPFLLRNMHRVFPALHLFIGQICANHTLLLAGQEIPLHLVALPGAAITIKAEKRSIMSELGGY
ncbi:DUF1850 domain-containing protein [uncultured Brevibacillus sp.]|uniref:DUF1850 domain-containing protein n=1 Tax=uncultured Brevibacillus sp. TaxID=169970 RepID=UPI00259ADAB0|nr:DUF1850 domain-containing protein [uncultured Brevibacillus sp.]